jgi:biotin carboxyl carrier protein
MAKMTWAVTVAGETREFTLERSRDGNGYLLTRADEEDGEGETRVSLSRVHGNLYHMTVGNHTEAVWIDRDGNGIRAALRGRHYLAEVEEARFHRLKQEIAVASGARGPSEVVAPMPGLVLAIRVSEGDEVAPGDAIAVVESMKMENEITTPHGGIVESIMVSEGMVVDKGRSLVTIVAPESA